MQRNARTAASAAPDDTAEDADLRDAQQGDRGAFERLVKPHLGRLRRLAYRLVGQPDDAADLSQEALVRAFEQVASFRGEARFSTWLFSIATHLCLDHLRARKRWRADAQPLAKDDCVARASPLHDNLASTPSNPSFSFDVHEHIAFCFTCVARSLRPEEEAALILSDVFDVKSGEAATAMRLTESVYRHRLSAARKQMQDTFEGLCALVNKEGTCYQCKELRDLTPGDRRGPEPPSLGDMTGPSKERWKRRLTVVRDANLEGGQSRPLHDLLFCWIGAHASVPEGT